MPILDTKRAVERVLASTFSTTKIAYEGVSFKPPSDELYLSVSFRVNTPSDPVLGKEYYRENISCNILVIDVPNKGTANAYAKAELVRAALDKGITLQEGSTRIHVLSTPQIAGSSVNTARIVVPVIVSLTAEVYRT